MRASSLSNEQVVQHLRQYFVPVMFSVDDYDQEKKTKAEEDEYERIRQEARRRGFSKGTVCVYLVAASGDLLDTMLVDKAAEPARLLPMLERVIEQQQLRPRAGSSIQSRAETSRPSKLKSKDGLLLHIYTRSAGLEAGFGLAEDQVELDSAEAQSLLPRPNARAGDSWEVSRQLTDRLCAYFFPRMGNYDPKRSEIISATLTASVSTISPKRTNIALHGTLEMYRPYGQSKGRVSAKLVGMASFDHVRRTITHLQLVSETASYVWSWQGNPLTTKFDIGVELLP